MSSNTWPFYKCRRVGGATVDEKKKLPKRYRWLGITKWPKTDPDNPSQPISAITHTPPGWRYNLVSKGFTQAWNTLEDPCIQTAMNICAPSYDLVIIVEAALKVFHGELHVGSPADIGERSQERMEDHIISTLHQECLCRGLDPNQWEDRRAMMPRS